MRILQVKMVQKLVWSNRNVLSNFNNLLLSYLFIIHYSKSALNCVRERNSHLIQHNWSSCILFIIVYFIRWLRKLKVFISTSNQIWKNSTCVKIFWFLWMFRTIRENILLTWMSMKVKKHLYFFRVLFFQFSYIVENARYLRKHFFFFRMLIDIPISVEIMTQNSSSVVS